MGDCITQCARLIGPGRSNQVKQICTELEEGWYERASLAIDEGSDELFLDFFRLCSQEAFEASEEQFRNGPIVAIVGSAPAVFDSFINADTVELLEREGCRVHLPYFAGYVRWELERANETTCLRLELGRLRSLLPHLQLPIRVPSTRMAIRSYVEGVIPSELNIGNGWRSAARMAEMIDNGVRNLVYISTFGCLSSHVLGRGMLRWARSLASDVNITAIEYDTRYECDKSAQSY